MRYFFNILVLLTIANLCTITIVFPQKIVRTIAGDRIAGYTGDSGLAVHAEITSPAGVVVDNAGNVYISDPTDNVVRKVTPDGIITTFAGRRHYGHFGGDYGPADSAYLDYPLGLALDAEGNLYIADNGNFRVRKVDMTTNIITTVAGNGDFGYSGDSGLATYARIGCFGLAFDDTGNLYIADGSSRVRKVNRLGIIYTVAGDGLSGTCPTSISGRATDFPLYTPTGVACDHSGNIYIVEQTCHLVLKVDTAGTISDFAGAPSYVTWVPGPATSCGLNSPYNVLVDGYGNIYISDEGHATVDMVNTSGIISTYAGIPPPPPHPGYAGDGGPPLSAEFNTPEGICFDRNGNFFICDNGNNVVREITDSTKMSFSVTPNDTVCNHSTVSFYANGYNIGYGPGIYQWSLNGSVFRSDTLYTPADTFTVNTLNNNDTVSCSLLDPALGYAFASDTIIMTIQPLIYPGLSIAESGDSVCYHTLITYTATPTNAGVGAQYQWLLFSDSAGAGDNNITFTYPPANGDVISCRMICDTPCAIPDTLFSNSFSMTILPNVNPYATVVADPFDTLPQPVDTLNFLGEIVTFFVGVNYGGTSPTYQWYINGVAMPGATSTEYVTTVYSNDTVYCIISSNAPCAYPAVDTSNITIIYADWLGINSLSSGANDFSIFPNPNNGSFVLTASMNNYSGHPVQAYITDITGKIIYSAHFQAASKELKENVHISNSTPEGMYYLRIITDGETETLPLLIKK